MPTRPKYIFLLSGFTLYEDLRAELASKIVALDGIYYESDIFKPTCTHLICSSLSRTEKVLGACITGKWILVPTFIIDSFNQGRWLDEEQYEWRVEFSKKEITGHMMEIFTAPKRCRLKMKQRKTPLFNGWVVALFIQDNSKRLVYKRLLEFGGAVVQKSSAQRLSLKFLKLKVKYIFATKATTVVTDRFLESKIICLHPDFIRNYVLLTQPPNPHDFIASSYIQNTDPLFISPRNVLPPKISSDCSNYANQQQKVSVKRELPTPPETPKLMHSTQKCKSSSSCSKSCKKLKLERENGNMQINQFFHKTSPMENRGLTENSSRIKDIRHQSQFASSDTENIFSTSIKLLPEYPTVTADVCHNTPGFRLLNGTLNSPASACTNSSSEKVAFTTLKAVSIVRDRKAFMFLGYWQIYLSLTDEEQKVLPVEMSEHFMRVFGIYHDGDWHCALEYIESCISKKQYIPVKVMHSILQSLREENVDKISSVLAVKVFAKTLSCIPPHNQHNREYYLQVLQCDGSDMGNCKQPWTFISGIISDCFVGFTDEVKAKFDVNYSLLKLIIRLLNQDFSSFVQRTKNPADELKLVNRQPLIARILWPNTVIGQTNGPCCQLFQHLANVASRRGCGRELLLCQIQELLTLTMECCRISEISSFTEIFPGPTAYVLAKEFANYLTINVTSLLDVIQTIQLPWVQMIIAEKLLDGYRNPFTALTSYLVRSNLNMKKIVAYYMYLTPTDNSPSMTGSPEKSVETLNFPPNSPTVSSLESIQVNKRNLKGETKLHFACKSNNVEKVRKLLSTPGIDVNAADNEGWTPLHEACNYGSTECVIELLKFRPIQKTIHMYFSGDIQNQHTEVNLKSQSKNGTTPLHDAVINNNIDTVKLLLEAGGIELMEISNLKHETPVDVACTKEMKDLLEDWKKKQCLSSTELSLLSVNQTPDYSKVLEASGHDPVPHHVYERYTMLVYFLLKGYMETAGLKDIWEALSKKSELLSKDLTNDVAVNTGLNEVILEDLELYDKYQKYVAKFFEHLEKISRKQAQYLFNIENFRALAVHV